MSAPRHNPDQAQPTPVTAALVSVGGAEAPILHVLRQHKPKHVWYFCSPGSRGNAEEIQRQLDWHPWPRFIEVERFEELGPCYRELRRKIADILRETKVSPEEVLVDYTCGTKTMSAALVLAAVELFQHFGYVGGQQREKGGLGIVLDGQERTVYQGNPWTELAIREVERARDLWAGCDFDAAAFALQETDPHALHPLRLQAFAALAQGMAARHRLHFQKAVSHFHTAPGIGARLPHAELDLLFNFGGRLWLVDRKDRKPVTDLADGLRRVSQPRTAADREQFDELSRRIGDQLSISDTKVIKEDLLAVREIGGVARRNHLHPTVKAVRRSPPICPAQSCPPDRKLPATKCPAGPIATHPAPVIAADRNSSSHYCAALGPICARPMPNLRSQIVNPDASPIARPKQIWPQVEMGTLCTRTSADVPAIAGSHTNLLASFHHENPTLSP